MTPPRKPAPSPRLSHVRLRDTKATLAHSHTYSRVVARLRWILPLLTGIGLVVLFVWPYWTANQISLTMVENVPNLMVENLNLTGLDSKNQPYKLTADRALQAQNAREIIDLENPKGELMLSGDVLVTGRSLHGKLNQEAQKLHLKGQVELFHDQKTRFFSDEMHVDLTKSDAWGSQPVVIDGDFGQISGTGFQMTGGGATMIINGPATARLYLHPAQGADKPNINHSSPR